MTFAVITLLSFSLVVIFAPSFIEYLKLQKMGQTIREDGPQTHLEKAGTPTMGGLLIFSSTAIVTIIILINYMSVLDLAPKEQVILSSFLLIYTLAVAGIGILDDLQKIKKGRNLGLSSKQKLALQVLLSICFLLALYFFNINSLDGLIWIELPFLQAIFVNSYLWLIAWGAIILIYLVGYSNAVNLTDGLDGLCGYVTVLVTLTLAIIAAAEKNLPVCIFLFALTGACLGFLRFNRHPAKLFMGDTGSLAIGAALAGTAVILHAEVYFILSGIVYLIEAFSVILQVVYFKITKGKRIFRMSPYHHHLEQGGWSETKIVAAATILTIITSIIALVIYFFSKIYLNQPLFDSYFYLYL